jgi:hypothetical protein
MIGWIRKKQPEPDGPDFSAVDSLAKAASLVRSGDLEKIFLLPLQFGGADIPENILYVPVGTAGVKARIDDNIIAPLVSEGKFSRYEATPEYQGRSFVPIAIKITASAPGKFTTTINIWGDALRHRRDAF